MGRERGRGVEVGGGSSWPFRTSLLVLTWLDFAPDGLSS